jgi:hypothetical protein
MVFMADCKALAVLRSSGVGSASIVLLIKSGSVGLFGAVLGGLWLLNGFVHPLRCASLNIAL